MFWEFKASFPSSRSRLSIERKDFTLTSEVESNLLTDINVKILGQLRDQRLFTTCSHPLGMAWHWSDLRECCIQPVCRSRASSACSLADKRKPAQVCAGRDCAAVKHPPRSAKNVVRLMSETDDCRYTCVCTPTHVSTLAKQHTLLDYMNSVIFEWFRGLSNITATANSP